MLKKEKSFRKVNLTVHHLRYYTWVDQAKLQLPRIGKNSGMVTQWLSKYYFRQEQLNDTLIGIEDALIGIADYMSAYSVFIPFFYCL